MVGCLVKWLLCEDGCLALFDGEKDCLMEEGGCLYIDQSLASEATIEMAHLAELSKEDRI